MHTNYFNCYSAKTIKTIIIAPTCFGLHKPSSGSYSLRFAKVNNFYSNLQSVVEVFSIVAAHAATILNTSTTLPDDDLCKPKHVGAISMVLNV